MSTATEQTTNRATLFDAPDDAILTARQAAFDAISGPRVGDRILMLDGTEQRFSHRWDDGMQTSRGGSFYLGNGYLSFSGSLYPTVPFDKLVETNMTEMASAWFFHHDHHTAHNGVDVRIRVRVYRQAA